MKFMDAMKLLTVSALITLAGGYAQISRQEVITDPAANSCELMQATNTGEKLVGSYMAKSTIPGWIEFPGIAEDKAFNFDTLYRIENSKGSSLFRLSEKNFIKGSMYLGGLSWQGNKKVEPDEVSKFYAVSVSNDRPGKTMTMVGDSITWWSNGRYLRCLLSKHVTGVNFIGPHTDSFGYGHAGEGGNSTFEILGRLDAINKSDYYFLLAGTNDYLIATPEQSFENLKKIAMSLSGKGGEVIVSTLLPRMDANDKRNIDVNRLLLSWGGAGCNCKVVDLSSEFRAVKNYQSMYWDEGVHPSMAGYENISEILSRHLQPIVSRKTAQASTM